MTGVVSIDGWRFGHGARCWWSRFWIGSLLVLLWLCAVAQAVTVCSSCGYEGGEGAFFCSHCGTRLDQQDAPVDDCGSEEEVETEILVRAVIAPEIVTADMRTAYKHFKEQQVEVARLFAKNALAMNPLSGDDPGAERATTILAFLERCARATGVVKHPCPVCEGTGKAVMTSHALNGDVRELRVPGQRCARCSGSGTIRGKETMDERKFRMGQALVRYRTLRNSAGHVPVGLVWLPKQLADGLAIRDRIALKRAIPPPCDRCSGLGRIDCTTCRGSGRKDCRAKGCEGGLVVNKPVGGKLGSSLGVRSMSQSKVKCRECQGTGKAACGRCSGEGSFVCGACNGSTLRETCARCGGLGASTCRRCKGVAQGGDVVCGPCRNEGLVECSSCGGTGRKR
jgi:hypothetical protein